TPKPSTFPQPRGNGTIGCERFAERRNDNEIVADTGVRADGPKGFVDITVTMSPRLRYVAPIVSLCALFACQAEPTKVTSLGGGDPAPPPPALPTAEPNGEDPGQGGGVPGAASSEFVGIPIPPP